MPLFGWMLFAAACVGHTALLVGSLNWWYGNPIPHKILTWVRHVHALLVVSFPVIVWGVFGLDLTRLWAPGTGSIVQQILAAYIAVCWVFCFGVLPAVTVVYQLRRPGALLHNHTHTLDVAAALGYKPAGRGKHARLARLPGNNVFKVDFAERALALPRLPATWEGLTILHVSDVHFGGSPGREFFERVMDECRAWEPDLVAFTGDAVDSYEHHRWIIPVLGRLRWRVAAFAVLGNHDSWYEPSLVRRRLRRLGMQVLGNAWTEVEVRGQPLAVIGHEGPWFRPAPDLSGCPEGCFRLCLSHTPDNIRWAQRHQIDLMLAGHNHGGQIRFPLLGSVLVPSRYGRRFDGGLFDESPTVLHVSRGLGGQHPLRYNCRPEVVKLVLHRRQDAGATPQ